MTTDRFLTPAKLIAITGFVVLLSTTYYLRTEVLTLNKIRLSSDEARAEYELKQFKENFPRAEEHYKVAMDNYELQMKHYEKMLSLYQTDTNEYMRRVKGGYRPPQMPKRPTPPEPPAYKQKLAEINVAFRARKHHYFEVTSTLNWVAMVAALSLVAGLLYLTLFDTANGRIGYIIVLSLSFVFLIGPSFHSIISAVVGFLQAPPF
jgi:hypothetical protein